MTQGDGRARGTGPARSVDPLALIRRLYPCRTVERDGEVVGAWRVTRADMEAPASDAPKGPRRFRVTVEGFVHTSHGRARGVSAQVAYNDALAARVEAMLSSTTTGTHEADGARFVDVLRTAARLVDQDEEVERDLATAMAGTVRDLLGDATDPRTLAVAVEAHLASTSDALVDAIDAFDPEALDLILADASRDLWHGMAWSGLDDTFGHGAPLRQAVRDRPLNARLLFEAWARDPDMTGAILASEGPDGVASLYARAVGLPSFTAGEMARAHEAMSAIPGDARLRAFSTRADAHGDAVSAIARTRVVGDEFHPSTPERWATFVGLAPAVDAVESWGLPQNWARRLLGVDGNWMNAERVVGANPDAEALRDDLAAIGDMAQAYARQVVAPAILLCRQNLDVLGPGRWPALLDAAQCMLTAGCDLAEMLDVARDWAAGSASEVAMISDGDDHAPVAWESRLPTTTARLLTVEPVFTAADLAGSISGKPTAHLLRRCALGSHAVVRVLEADGNHLSTALLSLGADGPRVVWNRAPDASPAPASSDAALRTLASEHRLGAFAVAPAVGVTLAQETEAASGYEVTHESWHRARMLWQLRLPDEAATLDHRGTAQAVLRLMGKGAKVWMPKHPVVMERPARAEALLLRRLREERAHVKALAKTERDAASRAKGIEALARKADQNAAFRAKAAQVRAERGITSPFPSMTQRVRPTEPAPPSPAVVPISGPSMTERLRARQSAIGVAQAATGMGSDEPPETVRPRRVSINQRKARREALAGASAPSP